MSTTLNIDVILYDDQKIRTFAFANKNGNSSEITRDQIQKEFCKEKSVQKSFENARATFQELGYKIETLKFIGKHSKQKRPGFSASIEWDSSKGGIAYQQLTAMAKAFPKAFPYINNNGVK